MSKLKKNNLVKRKKNCYNNWLIQRGGLEGSIDIMIVLLFEYMKSGLFSPKCTYYEIHKSKFSKNLFSLVSACLHDYP